MADPTRKLPWFNPGDRLALSAVFVVLIGLVAAHWALSSGAMGPDVRLERAETIAGHRIDINRAAWWELQALDGIGEKRAREIVGYRDRHGPFGTVDDLTRVRGIGPKTMDRLRPHLAAGQREGDDGAR